MANYPVVLVLSESDIKIPQDIINEILKSEQEGVKYHDELGFIHKIETKYYKIDILLVPIKETTIEDLPKLLQPEFLKTVEGIIVYFDSKEKSFLNKIEKIEKIINEIGLEMGALLCDTLFENDSNGITFKNIKDRTKTLDIVELGRTRSDDEDDTRATTGILSDPIGYDEVRDILRNCIWSNIDLNSTKRKFEPSLTDNSKIAAGGNSCNSSDSSNSSNGITAIEAKEKDNESTIETELDFFEKLLNEVMVFKNQTANFSRNEKLAYAEKVAEKFDKILQDIDRDDDDDDD